MIKVNGNAKNMKKYIYDTTDIVFGSNSILKQVPQIQKLDIATGGEDIGDLPSLEGKKIIGKGLKIMTPRQMIRKLPILLA